jgi:hypothetical protein
MQVQYSTDGNNWFESGAVIYRHDGNVPQGEGQWRKYSIQLPAAAGNQSQLYVGFLLSSSDDIPVYLDYARIINTNIPLPLTVEYFNGKKAGADVGLSWKVNCNNASSNVRFDVERSTDARSFTPIHSFNAAASRCVQPFDFTDKNAAKGLNYYRIRMTEADGKTSYTAIISVLGSEKGFELVGLTPSVTNGPATLQLTSAQKTKLELVVHDMQGRTMQRISRTIDDGSTSLPLNFGALANGVYRLSAYTPEGVVKTLAFLKQ